MIFDYYIKMIIRYINPLASKIISTGCWYKKWLNLEFASVSHGDFFYIYVYFLFRFFSDFLSRKVKTVKQKPYC